MATMPTRFPQRDLTKRMTVEIEVHRPIRHRLPWVVGLALMRAGAWLAGFAGVRVEEPGR